MPFDTGVSTIANPRDGKSETTELLESLRTWMRSAYPIGSPEEDIIITNRGRPIFIIGCGRSGTTLLGLMLQAHPRIAIPPENRFVRPTYLHREDFGDLNDAENRRALAERIVSGKRWYRNVGLDPAEITEQIVASTSTVGSALGVVLRAYADLFDKVRWGDKRPAYHAFIWGIQRMFPDAQFINIVRDGRDVVASMRTVPPWDKVSPQVRIDGWAEAIDHTTQARQELRPDSFYELQYESLVADPEKELRPLCDFLGERFDEAMLSPQSVADQVVPAHKHWHARTRHEVSAKSVGGFRGRLETWELQLCEAVLADKLEQYGYPLTGAEPPPDEHLEEYHRVRDARRKRLTQLRTTDEAKVDRYPIADVPGIEAHKGRANELERQIATRTRQRDKLQSDLDHVLGSRSWRWTQPIRTAINSSRRR